ncbi:hypothetical protein BV25DRAFT_1815988 [Artomyces pyxidatus]|uniref:Uncharacterized protein n=1 Tax=Artomyces pyxidatus TaxID=48021 RepID=A0ACB8SFD8_9AGAM|nr:hypothetical protein BV25DRAFT_1815988 [Artomyces pyxidatus]
MFGVPKVLATYEVCRGSHSISKSLGPVVSDLDPPIEDRCHVRTIMGTFGRPVNEVKTPAELIEAIIHAFIGYSNILGNGWIHRDVSYGNILLLGEPEKRDLDILTRLCDKCIAMIIDGDQAVQWPVNNSPVDNQRTGTLPFISMRLAAIWDTLQPVEHSFHDDHESFIWILLWTIILILSKLRQLLTIV